MGRISTFLEKEICRFSQIFVNDENNNCIINKLFPTIFVITLVEDYIRQAHLIETMKRIGANYTICYMLRPTTQVYDEYLNNYNNKKSTNNALKEISISELGCVLSHVWVLSKIINKNKLSLVLEDDIMPIKNFDNALKNIIYSIPSFQNGDLWMLTANDYHKSTRNIDLSKSIYVPEKPGGNIYSTGAYCVNTDTAKFLVNKLLTLDKCADHYFLDVFNSYEKSGVLTTPLFLTDVSHSNIKNRYDTEQKKNIFFSKCFPELSLDNYDYLPLSVLHDKYIIHKFIGFIDKFKSNQEPGHNIFEIVILDVFKRQIITSKNRTNVLEFIESLKRSSWNLENFKSFIDNIIKKK